MIDRNRSSFTCCIQSRCLLLCLSYFYSRLHLLSYFEIVPQLLLWLYLISSQICTNQVLDFNWEILRKSIKIIIHFPNFFFNKSHQVKICRDLTFKKYKNTKVCKLLEYFICCSSSFQFISSNSSYSKHIT